jgi:uncharacterized membrane protein
VENGTRIIIGALIGASIGALIEIAPDESLWAGGWIVIIGAVVGAFIGWVMGD